MKISFKKTSLAPCPLTDVKPGEIFWYDHWYGIDSHPVLFLKIDSADVDDERCCAINLDTFILNKFEVSNMLVYTEKSDLLIDISKNA